MLDEEMDHMIREAANNHHPAYNDKAWKKMELKLDKHLPQKTDRRRLIFFLLFFLLLGAGGIFTLYQIGNNKNKPAEKNIVSIIPDAASTENSVQNTQTVKEQTPVSGNTDEEKGTQIPGIAADKHIAETTGSKIKLQKEDKSNKFGITVNLNNNNNEIVINRKRSTANKSKTKIKIVTPLPFEETQTDENLTDRKKSIAGKTGGKIKVNITTPVIENDDKITSAIVTADNKDKENGEEEMKAKLKSGKDSVKPVTEDKKLIAAADKKPESPKDKKKPENKFKDNFGLTFSVVPDMSFVKINNTGKTTLTYGAGISYGFAKRFTARAGFYVSKKIYDAAPDQYHSPGGNYPYLTDVEANCKVYEIPVSLSYSFGQHKKHNWFGSLGLSSFLMKKEDYVYNYKTPAGQTYDYYKKLSNENKHYFAVLNLSGGYQYQLNKRLSLIAEPYLRIPLAGVGFGKVKLNSVGILFTLTLKPFAKK